jgi:hypothetical protein
LIYGASVTLWLFLVLFSIVQLAYGGDTPDWWTAVGAFLVAVGMVVAAVRWIAQARRDRQHAMRAAAELAVACAKKGLRPAAASDDFCILCAGLADKNVARSSDFWDLLKQAQADHEVPPWLSRQARRVHDENEKISDAKIRARTRAEYYSGLPSSDLESYYGLLAPGPSPSREAYFVSLIADLPPRWIDDVATKRR